MLREVTGAPYIVTRHFNMVLQYILVAVAAGMFVRSRFGVLSKYFRVYMRL